MRILNHDRRIRPIFLLPLAVAFFGIAYVFMVNERYILTLVFWLLTAVCIFSCFKDSRLTKANRRHAHMRDRWGGR